LRTILFALALFFFVPPCNSQTITVDITQPVNRFVPQKTLGAGVDRIPVQAIDKDLTQPNLGAALSAGWQPVTYRQNTELAIEAWHWNPQGTWSDSRGVGYFTGSSEPGDPIRYSYGYRLPRRGFTRNDGTENAGFSRLTDGDDRSFWKSNPYLSQRFTGESDSLHPQWVVLDLSQSQAVNAIRIAWAQPYATKYVVQYWTGEDPIHSPTRGVWQTFLNGSVTQGRGGTETIPLNNTALPVRHVRLWMTASSNTCNEDGPGDPRNCVGYAIRELYLGTLTNDKKFHDVLRHTPDQEQTTTYCSSVDPWHEPSDLGSTTQAQVGFDLFYTSGVTRNLPAMMPVAMLYDTPENAAAEIQYLENRKYPISYVEMGEEADGQYMLPEDYAALYLQWATALHKVDPSLKLGGPSFQGVNRDIEVWPDELGRVSWLGRFVDYLKQHGRMQDLAFFSFEHYPYDPCRIPWGMLYDEPELVRHIMQVWREDGISAEIPMFITEGNLSSAASETYQDLFSGLWLADYVGSFLTAGGKGLYYFHYLPLKAEPGCNGSPGTFGMFSINSNYVIQQPLAQLFVAQLVNLEWADAADTEDTVFRAHSDLDDGAGHELVTAYAIQRPDGSWALLAVNRDQENSHKVRVAFSKEGSPLAGFSGEVRVATFGRAQYGWHPSRTRFVAHAEQAAQNTIVAVDDGKADPDGPILRRQQNMSQQNEIELPAASVTVLRGRIQSK